MKIGPALTPSAREICFAIRRAVFIEEQGIAEAEEWDDLDTVATHFLCWHSDGPAATARLMVRDDVVKIGRVAVLIDRRGAGLGLKLMRAMLRVGKEKGCRAAELDSQIYAMPFYERIGFVAEGPEFDDAGIPHRKMVRSLAPIPSLV